MALVYFPSPMETILYKKKKKVIYMDFTEAGVPKLKTLDERKRCCMHKERKGGWGGWGWGEGEG